MTPQEELAALRRMAALEARATGAAPAGGGSTTPAPAAPQDQSKPFERAGWGGAIGAGVAGSVIKAGYGVKQLFGGLDAEDRAVLAEVRKEEDADPKGFQRGVGGFAGDVAMLAAPAGALAKATMARQALGKFAPAAAAFVSGAGTEGLVSVGGGDTYGQQMANKGINALQAGATGAAVQGVLGGALRTATGLFKAKPEAEKLFAQGINPTLQQGADTGWGRFVGGLASGSGSVRDRQEQEVANWVTRRATEGNVSLPRATGREAVQATDTYIDDAYSKLWRGKRVQLSPTEVSNAQQAAQQLNVRGQNAHEASDAGRVVANLMGNTGDTNRNMKVSTLMDNYINKLSSNIELEKNPEIQRRLMAARESLVTNVRDKSLTPAEAQRLIEINTRNFDLERMKEATKGSGGELEGMSLSKLAAAYSKHKMPTNTTMDDGLAPALRVIGATPTQDEARAAKVTWQRILGAGAGAGLGYGVAGPAGPAAMGALYATSALGQSEKGAKFLMGQTSSQKKLANFLRQQGPRVTLPAASGLSGGLTLATLPEDE